MKKMSLSVECLESRAMMAVVPVDPTVRTLYNTAMADGQINRTEMIGLFQRGAAAIRDLRNIVAGSPMPEDVKCLAADVLAANPTASNMNFLVDKWFYGKDRPAIGQGGFYAKVNGSLFVNGVSSSDIKQGATGDCYLLASLGALADKNNTAVTTMFRDNMDDTWTVRFYRLDGTRYVADYVTVDRYLPVNSSGRAIFQDFGGTFSSSGNELWAALAEKAYAQFSRGNSYGNMSGGWSNIVFGEVTGAAAQGSMDMTTAQSTLVAAVTRGDPVVVYRYMDAAKTRGHAYYVQSYSNGCFYLKNPYGKDDLALNSWDLKSQCYGYAIATRTSQAARAVAFASLSTERKPSGSLKVSL